MPGNGSAAAGAIFDNSYLPYLPGSEEVARKTSPETSRMSQNLDEPDGACIGEPVVAFQGE